MTIFFGLFPVFLTTFLLFLVEIVSQCQFNIENGWSSPLSSPLFNAAGQRGELTDRPRQNTSNVGTLIENLYEETAETKR